MNWSSASGLKELEAELRRIGGHNDDEIDLAQAALLLAALDRPRVPLERYLHHLSLLARDTADAARKLDREDTLAARAAALNQVIVERYGYAGDDNSYDDLQNANLMRVIDRRKGLPVTLGILYLQTARAQGWVASGLGFPGHFLIRLESGGERMILDPFAGGRACDTADLRDLLKAVAGSDAELSPEHYAPVSNRDILLRVQANIKLRLLRDQRPAEALEVVESMLMLAPGEATLWREAGLLNAHLDNLRAAIVALEQCLELSRDEGTRHEAAVVLQGLRARLN